MNIKLNAIYRYEKGEGWCKHGIVYTYKENNEIYCADTYWDSKFRGIEQECPNTETIYKAKDIFNDLKYVMDIKDIKQVNEKIYFQYNEKDRILIPIGGWHERYLINKNARPNKQYVVEQLKFEIESLKWQIKSAKEKINEKEKELNNILE